MRRWQIMAKQDYAPGRESWLNAGRELGFPVADANGPQIKSFTPLEFTKKFGRRVSSYVGYIEPIMQRRQNLKIIMNVSATRVIFDGNKAVAVEYVEGNVTESGPTVLAFSRKEIIVSAGAYGSPSLLMRSGIGPTDALSAAGIPVRRNLPVGIGLQNHPVVPLQIIINDTSVIMNNTIELTPENLRRFYEYGEGPFTLTSGLSGQAFSASGVATRDGRPEWPDMQFTTGSTSVVLSDILDSNEGMPTLAAYAYLVRPKSRGFVRIRSNNTFDMPIVDFRYLTHADDKRVILEGVKFALRIVETTNSYRKIGAHLSDQPLDACAHLPFRSDEYWLCYIGQLSASTNHPVSTCRMGRGAGDPDAVVDSELRLIGHEGIRVVDSSIMPAVPNANTQAPTYAIAEKGSELIINTWKNFEKPKWGRSFQNGNGNNRRG
ncbi:Glucose dehydrogenase [FAD, quinone] [Orchesella cincta]|uniref:Glucose dehydrogenase [FAD, quinone] n=1 Tax=Orchesella cincta TaxID=48709 RepID=A0A1D2MPI7_ORCCI|nr:Glucose dehydrogenase [FAD, quinone] [Orchesella cincta]